MIRAAKTQPEKDRQACAGKTRKEMRIPRGDTSSSDPVREEGSTGPGIRAEMRRHGRLIKPNPERRQALQTLQLSERSLNDFFDQSPLAFLWVEPGGRIRRINAAGETLLGCARGVCEKSRLEEFFVDRNHARRALRRLAAGEELHQERAGIRRWDRAVRHVLIDANGTWVDGRLVYSRWFVRDITRRVQLEQEVLAIAEQEQRRIGKDLHDDLCQQLAGIQFLSQSLANQLRATSATDAQRADNIARMVKHTIDHTRELARGLSPMQFERGLPGALQALANITEKLFGVSCRFSCSKPVEGSDESTTIHLYRIAQEAVSNAIKHGKSRRIRIGLQPLANRLVLTVRDDGVGLPQKPSRRKGMGLRVMEYRAGVIGGTLFVRPNTRGGTTVTCTVPAKTINRNGT